MFDLAQIDGGLGQLFNREYCVDGSEVLVLDS
jgi:hypothetical protein